ASARYSRSAARVRLRVSAMATNRRRVTKSMRRIVDSRIRGRRSMRHATQPLKATFVLGFVNREHSLGQRPIVHRGRLGHARHHESTGTGVVMSEPTNKTLPLQGLKVIEMGQLIAGPFASKLLGEFGADVIKIEPPKVGDPLRKWRK